MYINTVNGNLLLEFHNVSYCNKPFHKFYLIEKAETIFMWPGASDDQFIVDGAFTFHSLYLLDTDVYTCAQNLFIMIPTVMHLINLLKSNFLLSAFSSAYSID